MECRLKAGIFPEASKKKKGVDSSLSHVGGFAMTQLCCMLIFLILHTHQLDFYNRNAQIFRLSLTVFLNDSGLWVNKFPCSWH